MSSISMVEANLPPGFRFHPKDEELVCDYLMKKVSNNTHLHHSLLFIEVDLNKCEPWEIPGMTCVGGKGWYFYSKKDKKYATGMRTNRATASGYWKATGKDRCVRRKGSLVGMRKTLVFYQGRAPKGRKTDWVMHEFRLEGPLAHPNLSPPKEDWVLCRVFHKNSNEITPKPNLNTINYHDNHADAGTSSSLSPLIVSYISFDQPKLDYHGEQVPCFSIFSQNQTNPIFPFQFGHQIEPNMFTVSDGVLNQISKVERNCSFRGSPSFGEVSSTASYLSDVGVSNNMWTTRY